MASLINVSGIGKTFGVAPLFENITLNIGEGDRLGLIGPNGAGKSTLLEILTGLREPDSGQVALKKGQLFT
jgi:ABC transport system ATP-binding/permease protein